MFCACDVCGRGGCADGLAGAEDDPWALIGFLLGVEVDGDGDAAETRALVALAGVLVALAVADVDELSRPDADDDDAVGLLYVGGDLTADAGDGDGLAGVDVFAVVLLDGWATVLRAVDAVEADRLEPARSRAAREGSDFLTS